MLQKCLPRLLSLTEPFIIIIIILYNYTLAPQAKKYNVFDVRTKINAQNSVVGEKKNMFVKESNISYQGCSDSKTPYCFPNVLLRTGGFSGFWEFGRSPKSAAGAPILNHYGVIRQ